MTTGPETKLRISQPRGSPRVVKWETLLPWMQGITRQMISRIGMRGALSAQQTLDSIDFNVPGGGGGAVSHNWTPSAIDSTHIAVSFGSVNGVAATGGDSVLVDDVDLNYVYAKAAISLSIDDDGYVLGGSTDSVVIESSTSEPTSDNSHRYFTLLTWQAGVLIDQRKFWNIGFAMRDDGTSTSTPEFPDWVGS